jgi:hypothetical protein
MRPVQIPAVRELHRCDFSLAPNRDRHHDG